MHGSMHGDGVINQTKRSSPSRKALVEPDTARHQQHHATRQHARPSSATIRARRAKPGEARSCGGGAGGGLGGAGGGAAPRRME